jgi:hypothetical protein
VEGEPQRRGVLLLPRPDGHKLELHVGSLAQRLAACREQPYKGMVFYDE